MEKQLIVSIPNVSGEDGLTVACRSGKLFRNDSQLTTYTGMASGFTIIRLKRLKKRNQLSKKRW